MQNNYTHTALLIALITTINTCTAQDLISIAQEQKKSEQFDAAIGTYRQIITQEPNNLNALFDLGCCYLTLGEMDKALNTFDTITQKFPHSVATHYNKAYTLKTAERLSEAIELYTQILTEYPDYDAAHLSLGFAYLMNGDFEKGWKQHKRYLKKSGRNAPELRKLLRDNTVKGKTILLTYEGGLGDTIQCVRYAQRLKSMGARTIVSVQKPLIPLLSRCSFIDQLIPVQNQKPYCDAHATLMSLPAIFKDTDKTFPNSIPYIFPDPVLVEQWKDYFAQDKNFKIGICWEADVHNDESRLLIARRGIPLHYFTQLNDIPGISLYSLQKCDGLEQLAAIESKLTLHTFKHLDEASGPFMDTAAIMEHMDLIVTVDTAIVHLAGALGRPTWLLHPYSTDWRWFINRTDSPWYPTLTIFKQKKPLDWQPVMDEVHKALLAYTNK